MDKFKINCFFEDNGKDFNALFCKGLEDFILEKVNL